MEHYRLGVLPWATPTKLKVKSLTLALSQERQAVPGPWVTVSRDRGYRHLYPSHHRGKAYSPGSGV